MLDDRNKSKIRSCGNINMSPGQYLYNRPCLRLNGYDYTQNGAYFLTICTHARKCLFGDIEDSEMRLNGLGAIVKDEWNKTSRIRNEITLDCYVIMPNHLHAIVIICNGDRPVAATGDAPGPKPQSLGAFVAGFKSIVTKRINELRQTPGASVWQRNYYEHVIRSEDDLNQIREYIQYNPIRWVEDEENLTRTKR